jgi:arylsulfatase
MKTIVFILVDNVGWGDFSAYGGTVPTPRIDSIATDGLRLNNYTVEAQCTPSRSAIMTGRLPVRSGTTQAPLPGQGDYGLATWEYTLAELFSDAGYATAAFGKWHLGEVPRRLPTDQGFDEWFGIKNSSDEAGYSSYKHFRELGYPEPQWWEGVKGERPKPVGVFDKPAKDLGDEKITNRAVAFLEKQAKAKKPFSCMWPSCKFIRRWAYTPTLRGDRAAGCMRIAWLRWTIVSVKFSMRSKLPVSRTIQSSCSAATTPRVPSRARPMAVRMDRGGANSSIPLTRVVTALRPWFAGLDISRGDGKARN